MELSVNGVTLHYTQAGHGQPLLLLHGNGEDASLWAATVTRLAPHFTVYALDTRGHGQSSGAVPRNYRLMAQDVAAFIAALGLPPVILTGFSDGGITALYVAATWPTLVRRLIVAGANLTPTGMRPLVYGATWVEYWKTHDPLLRLMLRHPHLTAHQLHNIHVPTLVLAGQHDVIRLGETRKIARGIRNARVVIVPSATHSSYIKDGSVFVTLIWPFIRPLAV
ncbi:alpha/beta fold hydrolase [Lacticaseibacillus daqingensis]|uniref:alpha/beta fold hydrolase n=1 Tax=Lacticaseibacillus daqingensis TaxID=2486014 RepID=UPI000F79424C|nr:alpha/beta fold hydrolase [Lacticaseibacillus daqingensis]